MKRPALYILIPFCLGIAFAGLVKPPILFVLLSAAIFVIAAIIFSARNTISHIMLFLGVFFTGASLYLNSSILPADHISRFIAAGGKSTVAIKGTVADDPITAVTSYRTIKTSFTLKASAVKYMLPGQDIFSGWRNTRGLVKVSLFSRSAPRVLFGDEVVVEGELAKPYSLNNPGLFSYAGYLELKDIYCCFTVKDGDSLIPSRGVKISTPGWKSAAYRVRRGIRASIDEYLDMPYSGFLKAILIGDRSTLKDRIRDDFVHTGTVHILAISGLNIGLIAAVFMTVFAFCGAPKKINLAVTMPLLILYYFIGGSNPPILRAVIMFAICAVGYIINRDTDVLNSLAIAALAILLWNPKELYDPSFQLSFASVAGILIFSSRIEAALLSAVPEERRRKGWGRVLRYIAAGVAVSVAAWLGTFPIIAAYFNIVSPVSVIANLIVVPVLFFLMASAFVFLALSFTFAYAAAGLAHVLQLTEKMLFVVNGFLAAVPFAFFRTAAPSPGFTFLFYGAVSLLVMPASFTFKNFRIKKTLIVIIILALFNIQVWSSVLSGRADGARITFFDVGQGDAAFLEFPDGNILLDGGSGGIDEKLDMGESVIAPSLWNRGIKRIDLLMITHLHEDHLGGILYILKNFAVGCVIDNGAYADAGGGVYEEYRRIIRKKNIRRIAAREGDIVKAFQDVRVFVLNPARSDKILTDSNDNSLVLKIAYRNYTFLVCGDIRENAISRLLPYGNFLRSDLLKVPHHGGFLGNDKTVGEFFRLVCPRISVISVGASNKYGMPSRKTLRAIADSKSDIYMTKDSGAIEINVSSGQEKVREAILKKN
ncbi:MAG: DNA internalization-related competence protein ComEC/Rec2 [Candidatus Omnitrophota bacterium]